MSIKNLWLAHRLKIIVLILIIAGGGYYLYQRSSNGNEATRYIMAAAEKGTLIVSVSGTGQVSASNQVNLKPAIAGDITSINLTNSQEVKTGQILIQLDAADANKAIRDAANNLETAKLQLEELKEPPTELAILQSENSLAQAKASLTEAKNAQEESYENAYTAVANAFLVLPSVMSGLDNLLFNKNFDQAQWNVDWYASTANTWDSGIRDDKQAVIDKYDAARSSFDKTFVYFKTLNRQSNNSDQEKLVIDSYNTILLIDESIQFTNNYLDYIQDLMEQNNYDIPTTMNSHQTTINSNTSTISSQLTAVGNAKDAIADARNDITDAASDLKVKQLSHTDLLSGPTALEVRNLELAINQKQDSLDAAREALSDYAVAAPFDGIITNLDENLKRGQSISTSTTIATIITQQKLAEITLNEVDVAQVQTGQSATLTFDAIEDLTITGKVVQVDDLGIVSQGVVSYGVKISFDMDDERVKPGMTISATIATRVLTDVILVPNAAVKSSNGNSYIETLSNINSDEAANSKGVASNETPATKIVTTGAANDSMTEITSGLNEGDWVIVRTNNSTTTSSSSSQNSDSRSILSPTGGPDAGGFIMR